MITRSRILAAALAVSLIGGTAACNLDRRREQERWATTENTNVKIDWDKVNEAYKLAEGPADLERRVNEIYEGDEIISIAVHDLDDGTQVVTGFFDHNTDGKVDEPEKIFTIQRTPTGPGEGQYQTQGYGHYAGYHSPMMGIMTGMLMGSMMSSMLMPSYRPMYTQPYTTTAAPGTGRAAPSRTTTDAASTCVVASVNASPIARVRIDLPMSPLPIVPAVAAIPARFKCRELDWGVWLRATQVNCDGGDTSTA
jgi:hypothetical protein